MKPQMAQDVRMNLRPWFLHGLISVSLLQKQNKKTQQKK